MAEEKKQVNVEMDTDLVEFVDELVEEDESNRSAVIRKLIRQEKARRQPTLPSRERRNKSQHGRDVQAVAA